VIRRSTCLYCEADGVETPLVWTVRGGCCPIHSAAFLEGLERTARAVLGMRKPELFDRGIPKR
jgi:hypothetical protein